MHNLHIPPAPLTLPTAAKKGDVTPQEFRSILVNTVAKAIKVAGREVDVPGRGQAAAYKFLASIYAACRPLEQTAPVEAEGEMVNDDDATRLLVLGASTTPAGRAAIAEAYTEMGERVEAGTAPAPALLSEEE